MIDLDFGMLGWLHLLASVAAMAAFLPAMLVRKGSPQHRASGKVYALAYAALSVTSLRAIAGPSIVASPVVGMTHGIVMTAFVVLVFYVVTSLFASRSSRVPSADPAR